MFEILRKIWLAQERLRLAIAITYLKIDASQGLPLFPLSDLRKNSTSLTLRSASDVVLWVQVRKNTIETINGFAITEKIMELYFKQFLGVVITE